MDVCRQDDQTWVEIVDFQEAVLPSLQFLTCVGQTKILCNYHNIFDNLQGCSTEFLHQLRWCGWQGSLLVAEVMAAEGYKVSPPPRVRRHDIIQVFLDQDPDWELLDALSSDLYDRLFYTEFAQSRLCAPILPHCLLCFNLCECLLRPWMWHFELPVARPHSAQLPLESWWPY